MRRLDWFVISLSLAVLLAHRPWEDPRQPPPTAPEDPDGSPFSYVLEDGTETHLRPMMSVRKARAASSEALHANSAVFDPAVYTWSSPVLARDTDETR
jgi:hypothetical protein